MENLSQPKQMLYYFHTQLKTALKWAPNHSSYIPNEYESLSYHHNLNAEQPPSHTMQSN